MKRKQCATDARSAGAFAGIGFKKGAVRPASQKPVVVIEKLVRPPIKRCPGMDAIVDIRVIAPAEVHHEGLYQPFAPPNVKFRRAPGGISATGADHIAAFIAKTRLWSASAKAREPCAI